MMKRGEPPTNPDCAKGNCEHSWHAQSGDPEAVAAFHNQNRLWLAEKKLAELGIEWEEGKGYVYNGKD